MENKILVKNFLDDTGAIDLQIRLVAGSSGLDKEIRVGDINRPGLTLAGFYDFFAYDRIQIFGLGESAYLRQLSDGQKRTCAGKIFFLRCSLLHLHPQRGAGPVSSSNSPIETAFPSLSRRRIPQNSPVRSSTC